MANIEPGASPGEFIVKDGDRRTRLYAVRSKDTTWVFRDGVTYEVREEAPVRRRAGAHESLNAPMPATVVKVNAVSGADVRQGDILVLLEAMKMELPVRAPADGRVTAVHCQAGDLVPAGAPLVEIG